MYVSIDLGKSNTRVASSKDLKIIDKVEKFPTFKDLAAEKSAIREAIYKVANAEAVKFVCVGMPGILNKMSGTFYKMAIYEELNGLPYDAFVQDCIKGPQVLFENDAYLGGYGEAVAGSGKEFNVVAYLTLSSGVGGVRIPFKEIDPSFYFSEPGHQIIVENGLDDPVCGQKGCLQAYCSGTAFESIYHMKPEDCSDEKTWDEFSVHLASGIINIISMWAPEIVVIGGGLSQKFDFYYPGLIENLGKQSFFPLPEIRKAAFGDESGLHGGFSYINKVIGKSL